ncbi:kelch-like protein 5 isoform X1 [Gigantopelta aegis]|uniref:kelch-like protein 5 isoform X1 n=1 Tax=Gigantopelta aegis TaxID=1735272 RepID=UPI001B88DF80|nr:kelch-like protein 5 isoform X1 [Gigantopelta aegis]
MEGVQNTFLKKIYDILIQGDHNDIKLVFQDGFLTGSKICLTALSSFFEAMFSSDMLEKNTGVVTLPTVSKHTFDDVLKFHFLGEDIISDVNCLLLFDVAEMLQLDDLKSRCLGYLNNSRTLTTENCIYMWRSFKQYGLDDLVTKALNYIVKNIKKLSEKGLVMDLTKDEYLEVLSQDALSQKEEDVLRDVQMWLKKNNSSVETMVDLFKQIRFEHVSFDYLIDNVECTSFVKEHKSLQQVVREGIRSHYYYNKEMNSFFDNRFSGKIVDAVFIINDHEPLTVACLTDNSWYELESSFYSAGQCFSAAVLGKSIYITGGSSSPKSTAVYNVQRKTWSRGPDLKHDHIGHCMAVLDETLYAIGGRYSNTIEQLQMGQYEWQKVGDLGCSRQCPCAEVVGENILVMGALLNRNITNMVQCFNTKTHAVCTLKLNITLISGAPTRSYLDMPNLYLVHGNGAVDAIHIADSNTPTLTAGRVAQYAFWICCPRWQHRRYFPKRSGEVEHQRWFQRIPQFRYYTVT